MAKGRPDFSPTAVDVVLRPDWTALEGTDKVFSATADNKAFGSYITNTYTVPAGKTLFITQACFACYASTAADGDSNQFGYFYAYNPDTGEIAVELGGNGGGSILLTKPAVVPAGERLLMGLTNKANHNCDLDFSVMGYER